MVFMYSCQISVKLGFVDRFSKTTQIPSFRQIRPVRAKLFHEERHADVRTDGQNGMTHLIVAIRNSANARNKIHSPYTTVPRRWCNQLWSRLSK